MRSRRLMLPLFSCECGKAAAAWREGNIPLIVRHAGQSSEWTRFPAALRQNRNAAVFKSDEEALFIDSLRKCAITICGGVISPSLQNGNVTSTWQQVCVKRSKCEGVKEHSFGKESRESLDRVTIFHSV